MTLVEKAQRWMKVRVEIDRRKKELAELEPALYAAVVAAKDRLRRFGQLWLMVTKDSVKRVVDWEAAIAGLGQATFARFMTKLDTEAAEEGLGELLDPYRREEIKKGYLRPKG